jgi:tetratricopeptide (TPR) repeat protein
VALAAYCNVFGLGLAQDAKAIVTGDPRIREVSAANLALIAGRNYWWPKAGDGLYRPVTTASYLFNYGVLGNGTNPAGYHAVNFLLHAGNALLVFELALLVLPAIAPAFAAAALWAVHPVLTEAVTNVAGRADLLAAMAVLRGLLIFIRGSGWKAAVALFAIATAGVFAKENAAVLPGLMLLWDLTWRRVSARRLPFYVAAAASLAVLAAVRYAVLAPLPPPQPVYVDNMLRAAGFWTARLTAIKAIGLDLRLLIAPFGLSADRSYKQIPLSGAGDPWALAALAAVAALIAGAIARRRRDPLMFWCAGFFGIALLPTSNLLFPIGAAMAERFLYLPSVGFAVAVAALLFRLAPRRAPAICAAVGLLFAGLTLARNPDWNDDLSLSTADLVSAPGSFRLHDMRAKALFERDPRGNLDAAIAEQEKAWEIERGLPPELASEFPPAYLGIYYGAKAGLLGSPANERSRPWFEKSAGVLERAREISQANERAYDRIQTGRGNPARIRVGFQQLYLNLANADLNLGRFQEALDALRYGQSLDPRTPEIYDGMALAWLGLGRPGGAAVALAQKALVDGMQPATAGALRDVYDRIPGAACAGQTCPQLAADLCRASAALSGAFLEARRPEQSAAVRDGARQRGCPSL